MRWRASSAQLYGKPEPGDCFELTERGLVRGSLASTCRARSDRPSEGRQFDHSLVGRSTTRESADSPQTLRQIHH
jgi:hypothetical protein